MKQLVSSTSPFLTNVADHVLEGEDLNKLIYFLYKNLDKYRALGIAAPQIGVSKRVIIFGKRLAVNPSWIPSPENLNKNIELEGCLSLPGVNVPVSRYTSIKIKYFEYRSQSLPLTEVEDVLIGMEARIFQHECDHLDGILITNLS